MAQASKNLTVSRSQPSVWDRQTTSLAVYDRERWLAAAWGSVLTMIGARKGGFAGGLLATIGAVIAVRAAMGRHDITLARHWIDRTLRARGWRAADIVDDSLEGSFPASDSPSWTPTSGATPER
jgi:hypothetical protein